MVDWSKVEANVGRMAENCRQHGLSLMPHIKTHKSVAVARLQLEHGAVGLTCSKISEANALLPSGVRRIFLAHSISSPGKVERLVQLAASLDELIVAVTSPAQTATLAKLLEAHDVKLPCLLALDTGLGREGARSMEALLAMKEQVDASDRLIYRGIYTHEGFTYMSAPDQVADGVASVVAQLEEAHAALGGEGEQWPGCSVTAGRMVQMQGVTGLRPGAYVFGDLFLTLMTGAMEWDDLALTVVATVVDRPEPGLALIDAGTKVFSSDKSPTLPFALPLDGGDYALTRMSEEHGFLTGEGIDNLEIGQTVRLVPTHVCPVVNLADRFLVWRDGKLGGEIINARGCVR